MAGKHEHPREDARTDGIARRGGEFVDSEIPGEERVQSREPVGEFVASDIPGESTPTPRDGEGAYDESEIPGEDVPDTDGVGSYTDSEIPGTTTNTVEPTD